MPDLALLKALHRIVHHKAELSRDEAFAAMDEILQGKCTDAQIAAFVTALAMRGESVDELVGFATAIREQSARITGVKVDEYLAGTDHDALVDTCGTGGDASGTFNISTAAAFVVAGAGVRVAKHGNRSITSRCGSADVIEQLGVNIDIPPARMRDAIRQVGIGFLFAPAVHPAMKYAGPARRQLQLRTVFNMLGPLTNPAGATAQVVGVYETAVVRKLARALRELGLRRGLVVHGDDGLDEITTTARTLVAEVSEKGVETYALAPEDFGVPRARLDDLAGGDAQENAGLVRIILEGNKGPRRDVVLVNAAAALLVADRAKNLREGMELAAQSLDSGAALKRLQALVEFSDAHRSTQIQQAH